MPTPRQYLLRGPCQIQIGTGGLVSYSKDNVIAAFNTKTGKLSNTAIGKVDELMDDVNGAITWTPDAQVTAALLAAYYPFFQANYFPGQSIFGPIDIPVTVWTRDGWKHVFACTAVTKQPQFTGTAVKEPFGQITFRFIRANNMAWNTPGSLVAVTQAPYPGDAGFNTSNNIIVPFTGLWVPTGFTAPSVNITGTTDASPDVLTTSAAHGLLIGDRVSITGATGDTAINGIFYVRTVPSTTTLTLNSVNGTQINGSAAYVSGGVLTRANGFDGAFSTEAGFVLDSNVTLDEGPAGQTDDGGQIDISFTEMDVTCKCIPVGPTPQEVLALSGIQDSGARRGRSLSSIGRDLYLNGAGLYVKLTKAGLRTPAPIRAAPNLKRVGELTWASTSTQSAGVPNPLAQISTSVIT